MKTIVDNILQDSSIKKLLEEGYHRFLMTQIFNYREKENNNYEKIIRLLFLLLNYSFANVKEKKDVKEDLRNYFNHVYDLLKILDIRDAKIKAVFNEIVGIDGVPSDLLYYFYLASAALLSENTINIRLDLLEFDFGDVKNKDFAWDKRLIIDIMSALILLVRKSRQEDDIGIALNLINKLKAQQKEIEPEYLKGVSPSNEFDSALNLLGLYHLAKILTETSLYLINGYNYSSNIEIEIRRHADLAGKILAYEQPRLKSIATILELGLLEIIKNSIWFRTSNLCPQIKSLCNILAENKIIELLPSQRQALSKSVLDPASSVTVVQMPTSAGKTLLAEFLILQTKALDPKAKIVYIVPTRALINQILFDLKTDFDKIGFVVEKTSVTIEIDPAENLFLENEIDVLISTPEKLDLLIRRDHPSVKEVSLFIVDEAHTIKDGERGAKLELLLSILKRERPKANFMLLSPFLGKAAVMISDWLAGDRNKIAPIYIDWKPAEKVIMSINENTRQKRFEFTFLPSSQGYKAVTKEETYSIESEFQVKSSGKKRRLLEYSAKKFSADGKTVLCLCYGPGTADTKAKFLYDQIDKESSSALLQLAAKFIEDEIGSPTQLTEVLSKRIAVHHSGLTEDIRLLIEHLIRQREIKYVFATTTIAHGINFPVSTVFFDDYRIGSKGKTLDHNDFWNVSGRAGRTLIDNYGRIILPFDNAKKKEFWTSLIKQGSKDITSALTEIILKSEEIIAGFSKDDNQNAGMRAKLFHENESLGALINYLVHLLAVSGNTYFVQELEDLFKDSYGYYVLENEKDRERFIKVCRALYNYLKGNEKGILVFADKTGFSVPSVLKILMENKTNASISKVESWEPNRLFDSNTDFLTEKIKLIAKLREVNLGTESKSGEFNAEIVAKILSQWVNGEQINKISDLHPFFKDKPTKAKLNDFVKYLTGAKFKASWGLSALEGIVKGKTDVADNSYIPSMVYFGVNTESAVWVRMIGTPRKISNNLANMLGYKKPPGSFKDMRDKIKGLSNNDWDSIVPSNSRLNGQEWKEITNILLR